MHKWKDDHYQMKIENCSYSRPKDAVFSIQLVREQQCQFCNRALACAGLSLDGSDAYYSIKSRMNCHDPSQLPFQRNKTILSQNNHVVNCQVTRLDTPLVDLVQVHKYSGPACPEMPNQVLAELPSTQQSERLEWGGWLKRESVLVSGAPGLRQGAKGRLFNTAFIWARTVDISSKVSFTPDTMRLRYSLQRPSKGLQSEESAAE